MSCVPLCLGPRWGALYLPVSGSRVGCPTTLLPLWVGVRCPVTPLATRTPVTFRPSGLPDRYRGDGRAWGYRDGTSPSNRDPFRPGKDRSSDTPVYPIYVRLVPFRVDLEPPANPCWVVQVSIPGGEGRCRREEDPLWGQPPDSPTSYRPSTGLGTKHPTHSGASGARSIKG